MQGKNVIDCAKASPILTLFFLLIFVYILLSFYTPPHKKCRGIVISSGPFECPFVRPSELRFCTLTWVVFDRFCLNFAWTLISGKSGFGWQWTFFCQFWTALWSLIDVRIFLCWISCELICGFRSNFVYALILTKCRLGMIEQYISFIFNRVMALDWYRYFVSAQYIDGFWLNFVNALILTKCR